MAATRGRLMRAGPGAPDAAGLPPPSELFAALPVAVLVIDPDARVRQVNGACEQLLNRSDRALHGVALAAVLPGIPERAEDFAAFGTVVETARGPLRADVAEAALPGHPGWRLVTLGVSGGRGLDRPVAARAATGAAAMLAHEIKNPLSGIRGAAQLLGPGELTDLIVREVDRIAALIDGMQDFTDTRPLPLSALNVHEVIDHVRRVAVAGFAREVRFEERFDPSLPPARANRDALTQVLLNLVKNAAEATGEVAAPRVVLATAFRHGLASAGPDGTPRPLPIEVAVLDNGPGAPPDVADHLFEPFVSGRPEGQGLGLALVNKLVRDMGGIVQYVRDGRPAMTALRVLLPRAL